MRKILLFSIIQRLLYHFSRVESLIGDHFDRIQGGEYPFIAALQSYPSGINICGGVLISNQHIITSAHCLDYETPDTFRIVFEGIHAQQELIPSYTADSWQMYIDWARGQGIPYNYENTFDVAIVKLTDKIYDIEPVRLNELTKGELAGKAAIMTGRKNDVVSKAIVNVLSDADCDRKMRRLNLVSSVVDNRTLCNAGNPFALMDSDDWGYPLLLAGDKSLLGIALESVPEDDRLSSHLSYADIRQSQVNLHFSIEHYRSFIFSVIPAAPGA